MLISGLLGFWPKGGADSAKQQLLAAMKLRTTALRDGSPTSPPRRDVAPGDVVVMVIIVTLLLWPIRRWGPCSAGCRYRLSFCSGCC